jgi:hypothetical protein
MPAVRLTCLALLSACLWLAEGCANNPNPLSTTQPTTPGATTCTGTCTAYISFSPWSVGLKPGASVTFSATANYVSDPGVTWTIEEGTAGGTITGAGVYTAPLVEGVYHVVATSKAISSLTRIAPIVVTATEFTVTGSMSTARYSPTASLLPDGQVFVAGGGNDDYDFADPADLYDPATGTFHPAGQVSRFGHSATVLANGDVLLAGGVSANSPNPGATITADLRKTGSGVIQPTGSMNTPRNGHTATLLQDGRVLLAGGFDIDDGKTTQTTQTAELYNPASGKFTPAGDMTTPRTGHSAALLSNGRVLIVGGGAGAELYDPVTNSFLPAPGVANRCLASATPLADGRVLIAGGIGCPNTVLDTAEIYDPSTGQSTPTGKLVAAQAYHTATLLPDGRVLLVGGSVPNLSQFYDPATGSFTFGPHTTIARSGHTATLLPDGGVLIVGGSQYAELYK